MKKLIINFLVCMLLFSTSCGTKEVTTSTMKLNRNGSIETNIVESFDTNEYDESDLRNWITLEINNYNEGKEEKIVLKDLHVNKGKVLLSVIYPTYNDYMELNGEVLFFGTVEEVKGPKFSLVGEYVDAFDTKTNITDEILLQNPNWKVFITNENIRIKTYSKVSFYKKNVVKIDQKTFDFIEQEKQVSKDEEYYILIFE